MSDSTKFINTYIDIMTGTLHEQLGSVLQLKTQIKILTELIQEKDSMIANMEQEKNAAVTNLSQEKESAIAAVRSEMTTLIESAVGQHAAVSNQDAETIRGLQTKLSHMDTLLKQLSDTQREVQAKNGEIAEKDALIASLEEQLVEAKTPKPVVAITKSSSLGSASTSKVQLNNKVKSTKTKGPDDDF